MSETKLRDTDFLYLTALLRAREARMLSEDRINRMLDAERFDDAAKMAEECGYRDMSGMNVFQVEDTLSAHRADLFREMAADGHGRPVVDLFRTKYDYHNVKVLVKSMRANVDASRILSPCGRIDRIKLTEAFISGERGDLPAAVRDAIHDGVSVLARTENPQLSDIAIDKIYFRELSSLAAALDGDFVPGYVRLLTDSANLRTYVRSHRTRLGPDMLITALIPGGNADVQAIAALPASGEGLGDVFKAPELEKAVRLASEALSGGSQTAYERACDNATMLYLGKKRYAAFGLTVVLTYLAELEWEITALRMILSGKLAGIAPEIIRERLREGYV